MTDRELSAKVAWVTGGVTGMGREVALRLAEMGADVAVGSLTEDMRASLAEHQNVMTPGRERLEMVAKEIRGRGVRALALPLDVTRDDSVAEMHAAIVSNLGPVDILINAAGNAGRHEMVDHPDSLWRAMIEVNLNGAYRTSKLCLPGMYARGWGRIVNFSSTAGLIGAENHAAYCASKTGLLGLTRCVALEGASHGVTCNALCPGWVASEQNYFGCEQEIELAGMEGTTVEEFRGMMAEKWVPQKRFLEPGEPGALAAYLCTHAARGITGEALRISAGSVW